MAERRMPRILNVNDDEARRYVITRLLERSGFQVVDVATGAEALGLVATADFDLVLLDVKLPDISGFEVCRAIKSDARQALVRVILLSAVFVENSDRIAGLESGADAYLTDPLDDAVLFATVRSQLHALQITREKVALAESLRHAEAQAREGEERLRLITDAAPTLLFQLDAAERYVFANKAYAERCGGRPEDIVGRSVREVVGEDVYATVEPYLRAVLAGQETSWEVRVEPGGRYYEVRAAPTFGPRGEVSGVVGAGVDVTRRVVVERERDELLHRQRAEAEAANEAKDKFLAMVSHELRTPLYVMQNAVHLLHREALTGPAARVVATLERNVRLQTKLIDDLLDISRIISGKVHLQRETVVLTDIVRHAVDELRPQAAAKVLRLDVGLEPGVTVAGDRSRLQQVVTNLMTNAIRYTPENGAITVSLALDGGAARIAIADTGIGIGPELLPRVFNAFEQGPNAHTGRRAGLGLGLAIVRNVVEAHGGSVSVQSAGEGKGATFAVTLPVAPAEVRNVGGSGERRRPIGERSALAGVRVVVVDDDADTLESIGSVLRGYGATVRTATSVAEAFEVIAAFPPHVLVSDIGMPGEDGYALIRRLRSEEHETARRMCAVAVTARARPEDHEAALASGFDAHVSKPVEPEILAAILGELAAR